MPISDDTQTLPINAPGARPSLRRIAVVINAASGSVGAGAAAIVEQAVAQRGHELQVFSPTPHEIEQAVRDAVASAPDLVLVLAGDGTARLTAELCGPKGPLVAPLPGGTLNMLPHALYGNIGWPQALEAVLDHGVERPVSGGRINGKAFYCAAILGSPALWGYAREAVRKADFAEAWRRAKFALRRAFSGELHYTLDGHPSRDAEAMILMCPLVSKAMREEVALEVAALEMHSAQEVFRLAFTGLISDWRHDPGVILEASTRGRVRARHSIPAILDGEIQKLPRGAEFVFETCAFRALVPPAASGQAQ